MKINNLGYLMKEGVRGIFLHGFMSFAAVCVTVACLLIVGSFSILAYNLDVMVEDLNQTSEILVSPFLKRAWRGISSTYASLLALPPHLR